MKKIAEEASSIELGVISLGVGVGYVAGSFIESIDGLPVTVSTLPDGGWSLVFSSVFFGLFRIGRSLRGGRELADGGSAGLKGAEEADARREQLKAKVESSLSRLSEERDYYLSYGQSPSRDPRDRPRMDSGLGYREAGQLIDQARAELLNDYELFLAREIGPDELEKSWRSAVGNKRNVRSKYGLPESATVRSIEDRVKVRAISSGRTDDEPAGRE